MSSVNINEEEPLRIYVLRILPQAKRDIDAATTRLSEITGDDNALDWYDNLYAAIKTLATLPSRCPIAPEDSFFKRQVRQLQYRRTSEGPAYCILFTIAEEYDDAPSVLVIHIRHASRKPIARKEAREIQEAE